MKRTNLLAALLLPAALMAQTSNTDTILPRDTSATTLNLKGVTVAASRVIAKGDRQLYLPTQTAVKNSTNGYDLLKKMMLPNIKVDLLKQSVSSSEGGVQVRINDIKAENEDILSLRPDEVIRVEYIDNPGVRYNEEGLAAVINYVVKRRYAGYVGGLSTWQGFTTGFNNSNAYFKYNHKKSEFSVDYRLWYRDYDHQRYDDKAVYYQPDGTERHINYVGFDNTMSYNNHYLRLGYNLCEPDKYVFNARLNFGWLNQPNYGGIQRVEETGKPDMLQYSRNSDNRDFPSFDLYWSVNLPRKQKLSLNAVGTYIGTDNKYRQREYLFDGTLDNTLKGDILNDYGYRVNGKKYSLISEAVYSKTFTEKLELSGGVNYLVSRTDNKYSGSANANTVLNTNNVYSFAQAKGKLGVFNWQVGVGANYISSEQGKVGFNRWTFRDDLMLSANVTKHLNIRYVSRISPNAPSLSDLSEVRKQSSTLQASDGNASLKPYNIYANSIRATWNTALFSLYSEGQYKYAPKAIMTSIIPQEREDGGWLYIWKPENQRRFDKLTWRNSLTVHAIKNVLDLQASLDYENSRSRGRGYSHNYGFWQYYLAADLTLGKWNISYAFGNAGRWLWGETVNGGENSSDLDIRYKTKDFSFGLGCLLLGYAQGFNYYNKIDSRYYKSTGSSKIKDDGNMVYFTFSWNFSHGRKYDAGKRTLENSDNDNGVR